MSPAPTPARASCGTLGSAQRSQRSVNARRLVARLSDRAGCMWRAEKASSVEKQRREVLRENFVAAGTPAAASVKKTSPSPQGKKLLAFVFLKTHPLR